MPAPIYRMSNIPKPNMNWISIRHRGDITNRYTKLTNYLNSTTVFKNAKTTGIKKKTSIEIPKVYDYKKLIPGAAGSIGILASSVIGAVLFAPGIVFFSIAAMLPITVSAHIMNAEAERNLEGRKQEILKGITFIDDRVDCLSTAAKNNHTLRIRMLSLGIEIQNLSDRVFDKINGLIKISSIDNDVFQQSKILLNDYLSDLNDIISTNTLDSVRLLELLSTIENNITNRLKAIDDNKHSSIDLDTRVLLTQIKMDDNVAIST